MTEALWINAGKITPAVGTATIATDGTFTLTDHGLSDGETITVDALTGGAVGVLVENAVYFVRDAATDTFKVALTRAGEIVTFGSSGGADVYRFAPQYTARELRRAMSGLLQRGDFSGGFAARSGVFPDANIVSGANIVSISGTTWTVHDHAGVIFTDQGGQVGAYLYAAVEESGSVDPADGTNDRIDALDVQIQDDDEDASGFRRTRIVYTSGEPAASPDPPVALASSVRLAEILVPAGGSPSPSLTFTAPLTVARGGVIPVRDSSDYPTTGGRYQGMLLWDEDLEALIANLNAGSNWATVASAHTPELVEFTSNGTFTKADFPWARFVDVEVGGPGGGSGGAGATGSNQGSVGAGGGGGGYARKIIPIADLDADETVTVGSGGGGGSAGGSGGTGTSSSFGTHCSATSGTGGDGTGAVGSTNAPGGTGGTGTGGDVNIPGDDGGNGQVTAGDDGFASVSPLGGYGGSAKLGGGRNPSGADASASGIAGRSFGGGAAGAHNGESQSGQPGAAGAPGVVRVWVW